MDDQINGAIKRARGYWFVDGFTEMAAGGLFVVLSVVLLRSGSVSAGTFSAWLISIASLISIVKVIGIVAAVWALGWLKDHFTYPRTGFVRSAKVSAVLVFTILRNVSLFLLLPILGLLVAALLITSADSVLTSMPVWFPVSLGLLWAVLFVLAGIWMGLRRFQIMGIMVVLVGALLSLWQGMGGTSLTAKLPREISQALLLDSLNQTLIGMNFLVLITGLLLIGSGFITFLHYRAENPTPYREDV